MIVNNNNIMENQMGDLLVFLLSYLYFWLVGWLVSNRAVLVVPRRHCTSTVR